MNSPRDLDLEEGGETPEDLPLAGRVVRQGGMVGWAHAHHTTAMTGRCEEAAKAAH